MNSRARVAVHGDPGGPFTVHVDAVVEHKHLGPARDHVEALKHALADLGCDVQVFDELQATTHPHLVCDFCGDGTKHAGKPCPDAPEDNDPVVETDEGSDEPSGESNALRHARHGTLA